MIALNRLRIGRWSPYLLLAVALWYCVLHSGVHATVAGVLAALTVPLHVDRYGDSLLVRLEHALTPWSAYLIVPLFGFANAGVAFGGPGMSFLAPLPLAIATGLFVGKQAGIMAALALARRSGLVAIPDASWRQLWAVALLCGIGFTMSLFIAGLAFPDHPQLAEEAKLGVLAGSTLSAALGYFLLITSRARR
jgi:NhaA family Na+:H+ antiporter